MPSASTPGPRAGRHRPAARRSGDVPGRGGRGPHPPGGREPGLPGGREPGLIGRRMPGRAGRRLPGRGLPGRASLAAVAALLAVCLTTAAMALPALTARLTVQPAAPAAGTVGLGPAPAATTPPAEAPDRSPSPSAPPPEEPRQPPPPEPADPPAEEEAGDEITAIEDEVTEIVNRERDRAGCGAVATDERLRAAARGHSRDMADNDYFDHTAPDGSTFVDRAARAGYPREAAAGENIAYGYPTPADVMRGWMDSDGHRRNLLTCSHRTIGVGLAYDGGGRPYWTQVFGRV